MHISTVHPLFSEQFTPKGVNTPSVKWRVKRQASDLIHWNHYVQDDTWEWVWDRFWSIKMYSNGTLLAAAAAADA